MGKCMIFNSRRDMWESISMQFCHGWRDRFASLQLVAARGGLLTFVYRYNDHFLVCNLLTERYTCLTPSDQQRVHEQNVGPSVNAFTSYDSGLRDPMTTPYFVVKIAITVDSKPCKLTLTELDVRSREGPVGRVLLRDSRISGYHPISYSSEEFWFILNGPMVPSPRSLMLGFVIRTKGFEVLIYELESREFRWRRTKPFVDAIKRTGKLLEYCLTCESPLKFFEARGTGLTMTLVESPSSPLSTFPQSLRSVSEEMTQKIPDDLKRGFYRKFALSLVCFANGDALYYIDELGYLSEHPIRAISVRRYTQEGSRDHISDWTMRNSQTNMSDTSVDFHIFKPTLAATG